MRRVFAAVLGLALVATRAQAADIGIGPYGGISIPVLNDLSKQGSTFGIRVPVNLVPLLTVELFYASSSLGDIEENFGTPIGTLFRLQDRLHLGDLILRLLQRQR